MSAAASRLDLMLKRIQDRDALMSIQSASAHPHLPNGRSQDYESDEEEPVDMDLIRAQQRDILQRLSAGRSEPAYTPDASAADASVGSRSAGSSSYPSASVSSTIASPVSVPAVGEKAHERTPEERKKEMNSFLQAQENQDWLRRFEGSGGNSLDRARKLVTPYLLAKMLLN